MALMASSGVVVPVVLAIALVICQTVGWAGAQEKADESPTLVVTRAPSSRNQSRN